jgi:hypothetical protein
MEASAQFRHRSKTHASAESMPNELDGLPNADAFSRNQNAVARFPHLRTQHTRKMKIAQIAFWVYFKRLPLLPVKDSLKRGYGQHGRASSAVEFAIFNHRPVI